MESGAVRIEASMANYGPRGLALRREPGKTLKPGLSASEQPPQPAPFRLPHRRLVARFAALDDPDRVLGPAVGLVELAGLSIAEGDPVAGARLVRRKLRSGHPGPPLSGEKGGAACSAGRHDRRRAGTARQG